MTTMDVYINTYSTVIYNPTYHVSTVSTASLIKPNVIDDGD